MTSRLGAIFWALVVAVSGFATFSVKYAVQNIEEEVNRVHRRTAAEQQEIRVLTAEWTYLNQPERLADLNHRFLGLTPISANQLQRRIEDIPLRPVVTPPPDTVIADTVAPDTVADAPAATDDPADAPAPSVQIAAASVEPAAPAPVATAAPPRPLPVAASPSATSPSATNQPVATQPLATQAILPVIKPTAAPPAAAAAVIKPNSAAPAPHVQLAKAVTASHPGSLDSLIAQIAETR